MALGLSGRNGQPVVAVVLVVSGLEPDCVTTLFLFVMDRNVRARMKKLRNAIPDFHVSQIVILYF